MIRVILLAALAATPLAACGSTEPEANTTNITIAGDDYAARIRALPEGQRRGVLLRAIRDAGRECQQVTAIADAGPVGGVPAWSATCDDGGRWVVALGAGGLATVTNAAELRGAR